MVFKVDLEIWLVTFDVDYKNLRQLCYPDTGWGFKHNLQTVRSSWLRPSVGVVRETLMEMLF